jgi:hypothetical protein
VAELAELEKLAKLMKGYCPFWPSCACKHKWDHWNKVLDDGEMTTRELFEIAKRDLFYTLECVSVNCPDRRYRKEAKAQLRERIFVEAREEDIERVAQAKRAKLELHVNGEDDGHQNRS